MFKSYTWVFVIHLFISKLLIEYLSRLPNTKNQIEIFLNNDEIIKLNIVIF